MNSVCACYGSTARYTKFIRDDKIPQLVYTKQIKKKMTQGRLVAYITDNWISFSIYLLKGYVVLLRDEKNYNEDYKCD